MDPEFSSIGYKKTYPLNYSQWNNICVVLSFRFITQINTYGIGASQLWFREKQGRISGRR
jgi:hypothetical protein